MTELLFDDAALPANHRSGFIAVVGRPNAGKSTLMNAYLGQKIAIVSPKAQTTRNRLLGILTMPEAQLIFVDTPGIHSPHHPFGEYMVKVARQAIPNADLVLWLADGTAPPTPEDRLVVEAILAANEPPPVILALNKIDRLNPQTVHPRLQQFVALLQPQLAVPISALRGDNRAKLLQAMIDRLPPGPRFFPADQITDQQTRFIAAELVREAALKVLRQEVPHALAIVVQQFTRRPNNITYIAANLFVERESQKGIVIGGKGKTLKQIGQLARPQIEDLVQSGVYLDLRVKVRPKWRRKKDGLNELGYSPGS
ncbi:MAG: GTPase Era [Anaerolineae bacterium]